MNFKKIVLLFSFCIIACSIHSQMRLQEDSINAIDLISKKVKSLEDAGAVNIMYLFSDAGNIAIVYENNNKIKAIKSYYKGKESSKFRTLKLSKDDKSIYSKCISLARKDTIVNLSNCKEFVHSFNTIFFKIGTKSGVAKGHFTSDCANVLEMNNMLCLYSIYKQLLL